MRCIHFRCSPYLPRVYCVHRRRVVCLLRRAAHKTQSAKQAKPVFSLSLALIISSLSYTWLWQLFCDCIIKTGVKFARRQQHSYALCSRFYWLDVRGGGGFKRHGRCGRRRHRILLPLPRAQPLIYTYTPGRRCFCIE